MSKSRLERSMFFMHGDPFHGRCAERAPWPKSRLERSMFLCMRVRLVGGALHRRFGYSLERNMFFMHEDTSDGWRAAQALWL